jgi:hypothetical protein
VRPIGRLGRPFVFGILLGLAVIVRPTNIAAVLLLGLMMQSSDRKQIAAAIVLVACGFVLSASSQAAIWYKTSGNIIRYSYEGEVSFPSPAAFELSVFDQERDLPLAPRLSSHDPFADRTLPKASSGGIGLPGHDRTQRLRGCRLALMVVRQLFRLQADYRWPAGVAISTASAFAFLIALRRPLLPWPCAIVAVALATINLLHMRGYMVGTMPFDHVTWETYKRFWIDSTGLPRW